MRIHRQRCLVGGWLLVILFAVGCSQPSGRPHVQGKVTFQGKPVGRQTLSLHSEGDAGQFFTVTLPLKADGTFTGEVPAPGDYKVVIEASLAAQEGHHTAKDHGLTIPAKYRSAATSDLVWPIHAGDNRRELVLKE